MEVFGRRLHALSGASWYSTEDVNFTAFAFGARGPNIIDKIVDREAEFERELRVSSRQLHARGLQMAVGSSAELWETLTLR